MYIKRIVSQHRRDFTAIFKCKHCGHEQKCGGYDDTYFHATVVPQMVCPECKKTAGNEYVSRLPKHPMDAVL